MHVMHREEKDGLGMAYRAGFAWCLAAGYEVVGQMDCDLSHPPEKLAEMRRVLVERNAGLVLGSRYLPGGGTDGWSRTRLAMSRAGCGASRLALGLPFSDLSGGFKLWRADCLAAIDMDELLSAGYAFQVETTQLAHLAGARIEEVPFVFSERVAGASKMTLAISLEGIRVTLALRRHRSPGRRSGLRAAL
jgi:dolichol-phosphate mannosyltransferase